MASPSPRTAVVPIRSASQPLAVAPFAGWLYKDAAAAVLALVPADFAERKLYGESADHFGESGAGWVGPGALVGAGNALEVTAAIRRQFAPHDVIGEALSAIEDAFSTEAQIGFDTLQERAEGVDIDDATKALGDEAIGLLTVLWDRTRLHEAMKAALRTACYAPHAVVRWWIPPGRALRTTNADGKEVAFLPRAPDFAQAAEWMALSRPSPDAAAVVVDEPTQETAAVCLDEVFIDAERVKRQKRAQIAFLTADGLVIRTVWEAEFKEPSDDVFSTPFLPMAEMRAHNLLTPAVIATQKQLDYIESVLTRTIETAGFPERYIKDAKPTGLWVPLLSGEVPTGPTMEYGGRTLQQKPEPRTLGSAITTELVGIDYPAGDGKMAHASPDVVRFEPVNPEFCIVAGRHARAKILSMCRQAHRAGESAAESSGLAYQQARAAFEKDLLNRKGAFEGMLRDLLTSALGLIEALSGKPGHFTSRLRITADVHVDAGPRSPEERSQDREDVAMGLLSNETALSRNEIEDVQAEQDRIAMQPNARLAQLAKVAEVFGVINLAASADVAVRALIAAGVDVEIANAFLPTDGGGAAIQQ